ncbi:probable E3 ubiquitin ligase complex SCF subunit sconB [Patiria miniata]|uniref:F-box domain-containing protein n=1 Tax=Patiria miniata TaxID=46514 RepID=A0A913Z2L1_PATMI|nr:probable E3 ubiquitin ligase complex SCF subunit sconB [Patiria miniata]
MASLVSKDYFASLPIEVKEIILNDLTVTDLCHVALCNRSWREAANQDALWRPLCQDNGWERYGEEDRLLKEVPFKSTSQEQVTGEGGSPTFPVDAVVTGSGWPQLETTCKWKEVYMKAKHLETNWCKNRFYAVSFQFCLTGKVPTKSTADSGSDDADEQSASSVAEEVDHSENDPSGLDEDDDVYGDKDGPYVCNMAGEGIYLAAGTSQGTLQIWDIFQRERKHLIEVDISEKRDALKMKDGIIAAGCKDGKVRTYSAKSGEQLQVMSGHPLAVSHIFFDGVTIVSVIKPRSPNSDIVVWNASDGACRCILKAGRTLTLLDLAYKDKVIAGVYFDRKIRVWDAESGSMLHEMDSGMRTVVSIYLGDGIVIVVSQDFIVKIWSLESGKCVRTFDVPIDPAFVNKHAKATYCTFNGELLAVVSTFWTTTVLDLDGKRIGTFLSDFRDSMEPLFFHGKKLVIWCETQVVPCTELWIADPKMHGNGNANSSFEIDESTDYLAEASGNFTVTWMSDTKLAFERHGEYEANDGPLIPEIIVRHYW